MHTHVGTIFDTVRNHAIAKPIRPRDAVDITPTVFVIDDDVSVRESLESLIRATGWQCQSFTSAEQFLAHPRGLVPCCAIVDLMLPKLSGLELQKELADVLEMPMIFVSGHADIAMTVQAMKGGAVEFLTKPLRTDLLVKAIQNAIERSRAALRLHSEIRALTGCYQSLTRRERQVMVLVAAGLLNKQVAFDLGISTPTVKAHRGQVMRKMYADSLADLVMMSIRLGLLPSAKH